MEFLMLSFFVVLALLSALGWVADSRDGNDWAPTCDGIRPSRRVT